MVVFMFPPAALDLGPKELVLWIRIWEFPKIRGTLFGGPYNKDPTI